MMKKIPKRIKSLEYAKCLEMGLAAKWLNPDIMIIHLNVTDDFFAADL